MNSDEGGDKYDLAANGLEIEDESHQYQPAQALLQGETVAVWSDQVRNPSAVRYACANHTEANLFKQSWTSGKTFKTKVILLCPSLL
jgi:hypothetical protein